MKKEEIRRGDLLIFRNGHQATYDYGYQRLIKNYYNENLECLTNSDYDIIQVLRPSYEIIYAKEEFAKTKHM